MCSSLSEKWDWLLWLLAPPDLCFVFFCSPTLIFTLFTPNFCRALSGSESLQYCMAGRIMIFEMNHSFMMPVRVGLRCAVTIVSEKLDSYSCFQYRQLLMYCLILFLTSLSFTVLSLNPSFFRALSENGSLDCTLCASLENFHAGKSKAQICTNNYS